jgi:hypothetical protein
MRYLARALVFLYRWQWVDKRWQVSIASPPDLDGNDRLLVRTERYWDLLKKVLVQLQPGGEWHEIDKPKTTYNPCCSLDFSSLYPSIINVGWGWELPVRQAEQCEPPRIPQP